MIWTEPSGSFRVEMMVTLNNDQRFGVTDRQGPRRRRTRRARPTCTRTSIRRRRRQGVYGYKGGPAFTPTTFASEGQLTLVCTGINSAYRRRREERRTTYTSVPVEYSFMGFHHTVNVPHRQISSITPRATC